MAVSPVVCLRGLPCKVQSLRCLQVLGLTSAYARADYTNQSSLQYGCTVLTVPTAVRKRFLVGILNVHTVDTIVNLLFCCTSIEAIFTSILKSSSPVFFFFWQPPHVFFVSSDLYGIVALKEAKPFLVKKIPWPFDLRLASISVLHCSAVLQPFASFIKRDLPDYADKKTRLRQYMNAQLHSTIFSCFIHRNPPLYIWQIHCQTKSEKPCCKFCMRSSCSDKSMLIPASAQLTAFCTTALVCLLYIDPLERFL